MKKLLTTLSLAFVIAFTALGQNANAQVVDFNGIGSSALFLEAGLGASSTATPPSPLTFIGATCLWTSNNNATLGNQVFSTDTHSITAVDRGNAWVAWTPSSQPASATTCSDALVSGSTHIYAYLQTDSVVGDRCLFNANLSSGDQCKITFPTSASPINSATLIYPLNDPTRAEFPLPPTVAAALNLPAVHVNAAGTDIRPEDAWFATHRANSGTGTCGNVIGSTQYVSLGYDANSTVGTLNKISSSFGGASASTFNVVDFTLPTINGNNYAVTPIGAVPILVVVNGQNASSGFGTTAFTNINSNVLAQFLDGSLSLTGQVNGTSSTNPVTTLVREPLSGTYNTMEYNVPNRTTPDPVSGYTFKTSQDVSQAQLPAQQACSGGAPVNPLNIASIGGGLRRRAIGTGQELAEINDATNADALGYGFWSVANFAPFNPTVTPTALHARYLTVDNIEPLTSGTHTGTIPLNNTTDLQNVTLTHVIDGTYPIWSLIRFVSFGATAPAPVTNLAGVTQNFVTFGSMTSRPDFVTVNHLTVVRSHFVPPLPAPVNPGVADGQPSPAANGHVGFTGATNCTAPEQGGDVGGMIITFANDEAPCRANGGRGNTGVRR
ncbi:MAG: hypothetical protein JWM43_950 [Acidobacteriaceae bacterium]|nr:hypothetical protein [Acidobacteriaceae bacterium]